MASDPAFHKDSQLTCWRPPSANDLGVAMTKVIDRIRRLDGLPAVQISTERAAWPVHIKTTTMARMDIADKLQVAHPECRAFYYRAQRWRIGTPLQNCSTSRTIKNSKLTDSAVAARVRMGQYIPTDWKFLPAGCHGVQAWLTEEMKVDPPQIRLRIVEETHLNDAVSTDAKVAEQLGTEPIPRLYYATRHETRNTLKHARFMLQIDMDAYYPSIPVEANAQRLAVLKYKNVYYALGCLATGARWSVVSAQSLTYVLVDIDLDAEVGVGIRTIIDNILIWGTVFASFARVVRLIASRVKLVNLQSSPPTSTVLGWTDAELRAEAEKDQTFAGEEYRLDPTSGVRSVRNSTKTAAKLEVALERLLSSEPITRRQFAALLSLVQFAMHTVAIRPAKFWRMFTAHRSICADAAQHAGGWDVNITYLADTVRQQIVQLVTECASRQFRTIPTPRPEPRYREDDYDVIIWTDASKAGWAAIFFFVRDGTTFVMQRPWVETIGEAAVVMGDPMRQRFLQGMSAHSEPAAIYYSFEAARRLCPSWLPRGVRVACVTDHYAIPLAQRKGSGYGGVGRGRYLNDLYVVTDQVEEKYRWLLHYYYIPGKLNPTDPFSRFFDYMHAREVRIRKMELQLPALAGTFCPIATETNRPVWMR